MTLAPRFIGAWQRRSIAIDGGNHHGPASVLWLQAGDAFADLRIPEDPSGEVEAFAGIATYEAPALTRHHTLDWNGCFAGYDCGAIEGNDEGLIKRGEFERGGRRHAYEEIWQRVDRGDAGLVLTTMHAMVVRVGRHCLALRDRRRAGGKFDVRRVQIAGTQWDDVVSHGDGAELPRPPVVMPIDWTAGSAVAIDGAEWRVAERWG
ncbi:MAG: hypothetical protein M3Q30_11555 [Actinomycetota bacterium]|nr:hypothetical protein [Actinomycetota bacterium]